MKTVAILEHASVEAILCECLHMPAPATGDSEKIQKEIAELARRALVQAGDIQDAEEKLRMITKRASRIVPFKDYPENP